MPHMNGQLNPLKIQWGNRILFGKQEQIQAQSYVHFDRCMFSCIQVLMEHA